MFKFFKFLNFLILKCLKYLIFSKNIILLKKSSLNYYFLRIIQYFLTFNEIFNLNSF